MSKTTAADRSVVDSPAGRLENPAEAPADHPCSGALDGLPPTWNGDPVDYDATIGWLTA